MNKKINISEREFKEFIYNKIQRANKLYGTLFFENKGIYRKEDAEKFIKQHEEYENIIAILQELQIYDWIGTQLYNRNDITIE
jgi:hypothetical protein